MITIKDPDYFVEVPGSKTGTDKVLTHYKGEVIKTDPKETIVIDPNSPVADYVFSSHLKFQDLPKYMNKALNNAKKSEAATVAFQSGGELPIEDYENIKEDFDKLIKQGLTGSSAQLSKKTLESVDYLKKLEVKQGFLSKEQRKALEKLENNNLPMFKDLTEVAQTIAGNRKKEFAGQMQQRGMQETPQEEMAEPTQESMEGEIQEAQSGGYVEKYFQKAGYAKKGSKIDRQTIARENAGLKPMDDDDAQYLRTLAVRLKNKEISPQEFDRLASIATSTKPGKVDLEKDNRDLDAAWLAYKQQKNAGAWFDNMAGYSREGQQLEKEDRFQRMWNMFDSKQSVGSAPQVLNASLSNPTINPSAPAPISSIPAITAEAPTQQSYNLTTKGGLRPGGLTTSYGMELPDMGSPPNFETKYSYTPYGPITIANATPRTPLTDWVTTVANPNQIIQYNGKSHIKLGNNIFEPSSGQLIDGSQNLYQFKDLVSGKDFGLVRQPNGNYDYYRGSNNVSSLSGNTNVDSLPGGKNYGTKTYGNTTVDYATGQITTTGSPSTVSIPGKGKVSKGYGNTRQNSSFGNTSGTTQVGTTEPTPTASSTPTPPVVDRAQELRDRADAIFQKSIAAVNAINIKDYDVNNKGFQARQAALLGLGNLAYAKPEKVMPHYDTTPNKLFQYNEDPYIRNNRDLLASQVEQTRSYSPNVNNAVLANAYANTMNANSDVRMKLSEANNDAYSQYFDRERQRNQYNAQVSTQTDDLNARNRAARRDQFGRLVSNVSDINNQNYNTQVELKGRELNLAVLKAMYPTMYGKVIKDS